MSYQSEVAADSPFAYFKDATVAPWNDDIGGTDITISGALANQTGPLVTGDTAAFLFDGIDDFGQVALNLSDTSVVTMEFWLWWDSFGTGFDLAYEFTASWDTNVGSLVFDPDHNTGFMSVGHKGDVGQCEKYYPRPSAAAWHHHVAVHDQTQAAGSETTLYIDGAAVTADASSPVQNNNGGVFANSTLNVMCRNGASLFGAGRMAHLAVYKSALSAARVLAHFNAWDDVPGTPVRPSLVPVPFM